MMFLKRFGFSFLVLTLFTASVLRAEPDSLSANTPDPDAKIVEFRSPEVELQGPDDQLIPAHIEVTVGEANSPQEAKSAQAFLEQNLDDNLKTAPPSILKKAKERIHRWWQELSPYQVKFAVSRFVLAGQMSMWTLVLTKDAGLAPAAVMMLQSGAINGGFMILNPQWQWFTLYPSLVREMLGINSETTAGKIMNGTATVLKWLGTEALFASLNKNSLYLLGLSNTKTWLEAAANVGTTVGITALGELPWGISVARLTHRFKNRATTAEEKKQIQFKSDATILGLSLVGVGCGVAQLAQVPYAFEAMGGVALSGWALFAGTSAYLRATYNPVLDCEDLVADAQRK